MQRALLGFERVTPSGPVEKYAPDPNRPLGGKARGFTVTNMLAYLKDKYGAGAVADFVAGLPKELAEPYADDVTANEIGGSLLAWLEHCRAKNVALVELQVIAKDTISFGIA